MRLNEILQTGSGSNLRFTLAKKMKDEACTQILAKRMNEEAYARPLPSQKNEGGGVHKTLAEGSESS